MARFSVSIWIPCLALLGFAQDGTRVTIMYMDGELSLG